MGVASGVGVIAAKLAVAKFGDFCAILCCTGVEPTESAGRFFGVESGNRELFLAKKAVGRDRPNSVKIGYLG